MKGLHYSQHMFFVRLIFSSTHNISGFGRYSILNHLPEGWKNVEVIGTREGILRFKIQCGRVDA